MLFWIVASFVGFVLTIFLIATLAAPPSRSGIAQPSKTTRSSAPSAAPDLELVKSGWKRQGYIIYITGAVRNNSQRTFHYAQINFNLYDKSGAQVGIALANVNNLEPRGLWKFKAAVLEDEASTYEMKDLTGF